MKFLSHDQVTRLDMPNPMCTVFLTVTRWVLLYQNETSQTSDTSCVPAAPSTLSARLLGSRSSTVSVSSALTLSMRRWVSILLKKHYFIRFVTFEKISSQINQSTNPCTQVYLLLWFWLFSLTILTGLHLMFRLAVIAIPPARLEHYQ